MRNALVIAPEAPYPMHGGGPLRTVSLIEYLRRDCDVDLVVFEETGPIPVPADQFRRILRLQLPFHSKTFTARVARNALRLVRRVPPLVDRFTGFSQELGEWLTGHHYDIAVVEHFWAAPYVHLLRKHARRVVIDLHNIDSVLLAQIAPLFTSVATAWERRLLPMFDSILVPSMEDARRVGLPAVIYPNAVPPRETPPRGVDFAIAMSANFNFPPNAEGLEWLRNEVWPLVHQRFPTLELRLIGKGIRPVDDAVAELARARLAVVPIRSGSGTRLKILEAWQAGIPVVSTSLGAEGLGARHEQHLLIADDSRAFQDAVARVLEDTALADHLGHQGKCFLEDTYTWPRVWQRLDEAGGI